MSSTVLNSAEHNNNNDNRNETAAAARSLQKISTTSADADAIQDSSSYDWTRPTCEIAIPALIGMMADPLLSLMDTLFVGRVGSMELAALGACTSIFHLAFNAFRATTTATTSLVATSLVQSKEEAQQVTAISFQLGLVLGVSVWIGLQFGGPFCLKTMGIPKASPLYKPAWDYLRTRSWAAPAVLGVVVAEGAFRGYGDTKIPLLASIVASLINLVLDPLLIFTFQWSVTGAAAATALSQAGALLVYAWFLQRRHMLPNTRRGSWHAATATAPTRVVNSRKVVGTIIKANVAMMTKQGSLLLAWAYATARATRLGAAHVAAHQVALSFWLVFALLQDGAAVAAQVLASRAYNTKTITQQQQQKKKKKNAFQSLVQYMTRLSLLQGFVSTALISILGTVVPTIFTQNVEIRRHLHNLMPHLAWQQVLVSLTLVVESLAVGANQFNILALGTCVATVCSMQQLQLATTVETIWSRGIVTLFCGRFLTAVIATLRVYFKKPHEKSETIIEPN